MDDEDREKFELARRLVEEDEAEQKYFLEARQEQMHQQALEARFESASRADVLYMWEHNCNENGDMLAEFEFQALCEAWIDRFGFMPPNMTVEYDPKNPPLPIPSRRDRKIVPGVEGADFEDEPADKMLSTNDVLRITGMSLSTLKRKRSRGELPEPHQISERRIGWPMRDISGLVSDMRKARRGRR